MGSANNLNISSTGVTGFTGTAFTGSSTTQNAILIGGATTNTISNVGPLTSGQVLIGSTSAVPVAAALTAGANVSIESSSGSITIGSALPCTEVTTTPLTTAAYNEYITNTAFPLRADLPSTAAFGSEIRFSSKGTGGFLVVPVAGGSVNLLTTSAAAPNALSTSSICAALDIVCTTQDSVWNTVNHEGTFAVQSFPYQAALGGFVTLSYLRVDGRVWCCGDNTWGQLGNNTRVSYSSPIAVLGNHTFIKARASSSQAQFGLKADGSVWAWGRGDNGALGNNAVTSYSSPISVVGNHSFSQIIAGEGFTFAIKADGSAWAWGSNNNGQLGIGTTDPCSSPVSVIGNHSFSQILTGNNADIALKADGTAWTWGSNNNGQLGNNTKTSYSSPISVIGDHSFIQIAAVNGVAAGLKADGSAWTWGNNDIGQLGNGTRTLYSSPISVIGAHSFIQISGGAGGSFLCGLKADGSAWTWGNNSAGQLGNNTTTSYSSPISVIGNHSFFSLPLTMGTEFGAAWKQNGQLWSWGNGGVGQLGNNARINYSSPILVLSTP